MIKAFNHTLEEDTESMAKVKDLEGKVKELEGHVPTLTTTVEKKKSGKVVETKEKVKRLDKVVTDKPLIRVGTDLSLTINLGNFESAKVSAWISYPCTEEKDVEETFKKGWKMVEAEVAKESEGVKGITKVKVTEE